MAKRYLVVAAQKEELAGLFDSLSNVKKAGEFSFYEGKEFIIYGMIGGIGKVSMAYRLGMFLQNFKVDEIINIGVAGSISSDLKPLDTFVATKCAYHDVDVIAFGYQHGQMCGMPLYFECDKDAVRIALSLNRKYIKTGLVLSGDTFVTKDNLSSSVYEYFDNPVACDMESAAVGQVAHLSKLPYVIIRTISDDASSEENKSTYEKRLVQASNRAGRLALEMIKSLSKN